MIARWAAAFALTELVEVPIYVAGALRGRHASRSLAWRIAVAFGASALTHPVVWFVIPRLWLGTSYWTMTVAAEMFAVGVEAIYFARFDVPRPLLWSLVANAASVAVGLTVRAAFDWP